MRAHPIDELSSDMLDFTVLDGSWITRSSVIYTLLISAVTVVFPVQIFPDVYLPINLQVPLSTPKMQHLTIGRYISLRVQVPNKYILTPKSIL